MEYFLFLFFILPSSKPQRPGVNNTCITICVPCSLFLSLYPGISNKTVFNSLSAAYSRLSRLIRFPPFMLAIKHRRLIIFLDYTIIRNMSFKSLEDGLCACTVALSTSYNTAAMFKTDSAIHIFSHKMIRPRRLSVQLFSWAFIFFLLLYFCTIV